MASVIRLDNLTKTYGKGNKALTAINKLSFDVQAGQIYGFLGPNGAGKTSTIKILLNLIYSSSGQAYLFDTPINDAHDMLRTRVGALVEEATFYPFMTACDNLRVFAQTSGIEDKQVINRVLDLVGMTSFADRKTKTFSTGMKQRLGVASALLNNPDLLILDEPSSGLDPKGIQDMRAMIHNLAKNEGKTIFLSSHLLHEIEQTCDRVAIIQNGTLIREGDVRELLAEQSIVRMKASPIDEAYALLQEKFAVQITDNLLEISAPEREIPDMIRFLSSNNIDIYEISLKKRTLEDLFLEVTHD
ncbi:MAG: ABC transporter ATP-binding protein [Phototrophicaceae bacterium]